MYVVLFHGVKINDDDDVDDDNYDNTAASTCNNNNNNNNNNTSNKNNYHKNNDDKNGNDDFTVYFILHGNYNYLQATDNDVTSPNKNFHFSFVPTTQQLEHNFTLDSRTGTIFPIGSLDYEKLLAELNGIIELSVKVEDQGKPALSSVTAVIITVEVLIVFIFVSY